MEKDKPVKATIIVLTYNQERTIGRAIESVLRQKATFPFEILIADDASTDGTRKICEDYAERYPELIRMMPEAPNKGLVDNYFDAVEAAKGEYIGDCAGDDEWLGETRLQESASILDQDLGVSVVYSDVEIMGKEGGFLRSGDPHARQWHTQRRYSGRSILYGVLDHTKALPYILSSAIYRKNALNADNARGFDLRSGNVEDIPVIALAAMRGDAIALPDAGYRYYADGVTLSNNLTSSKEYHFQSQVASMIRMLGDTYGLAPVDQIHYFREKFPYLAAQIRHSGEYRSLIGDFESRLRLWNIPLPLRGKIHLILARIASLFRANINTN